MSKLSEQFIQTKYQEVSVMVKKEKEKKEILLAKDVATGELVVVKRLRDVSDEVVKSLQDTVHKNLPHVIGFVRNEDGVVIVEEYVHGLTLETLLADGVIEKRRAIGIVIQLLYALEYLHKQGIVHRDVKPSNVMVGSEDVVTLLDFDIARKFKEKEQGKDTRQLGTMQYAPPEQFGYQQTDPRSDIYALGVLFNELLTGRISRHDVYPGRLGGIIKKCISFTPEHRYQNAYEMIRSLKRYQRFRSPIFLSFMVVVAAATLVIGALSLIHPKEKPVSVMEESMVAPIAESLLKVDSVLASTGFTFEYTPIREDGKWKDSVNMGDSGVKLDFVKSGDALSLTIDEEWNFDFKAETNLTVFDFEDNPRMRLDFDAVYVDLDQDECVEILILASNYQAMKLANGSTQNNVRYSNAWVVAKHTDGYILCDGKVDYGGSIRLADYGQFVLLAPDLSEFYILEDKRLVIAPWN